MKCPDLDSISFDTMKLHKSSDPIKNDLWHSQPECEQQTVGYNDLGENSVNVFSKNQPSDIDTNQNTQTPSEEPDPVHSTPHSMVHSTVYSDAYVSTLPQQAQSDLLDFRTSTIEENGDRSMAKPSSGKNNYALPPLRALLIRSESGPLGLKHGARLEENTGLVKALGWNLIEAYVCRLRRSPHPATFLGKGWVERITAAIKAHDIQIVIMDPDLTSIQQRVLEKTWKCDVLDRTALILRIFQHRARTAAGQLQVKLASLLYQKSRLVRAWTHLERQRGGFGFLGGPGESQLELDRRILDTQILKIKKQLEQVRKTRALHRKSRQDFPTVTLVGYTNTGKSTLFRALTGADILCADMPFATLDPTVRKIRLPSGRFVLLTDTVGFISELPSFLKLAFQATLEEIHEADLIIHVRDMACMTSTLQKEDVLTLLHDLKCIQTIIEVWNKADLVPKEAQLSQPGLWISAREKTGILPLLKEIDHHLFPMDLQP
jgi:GTP-binding protein HflX